MISRRIAPTPPRGAVASCVPASSASSIDTACAATDLALGDMEADVALGAIGVERYVRAIEHHQQLGLVGVQPREQAIQRDEAGASMEDALEAGTQLATAPRGGVGAIRLEDHRRGARSARACAA